MSALVERSFRFVLLAVLGLSVGACSPVKFRVKVLEGELSMIAQTSSEDPRLDQEGIPGAEVTVSQTGRAGDIVIRKTNSRGATSIPLAGTGALSRPIAIRVDAPGFLPAVIENMPTPVEGRALLVLLEPIRTPRP